MPCDAGLWAAADNHHLHNCQLPIAKWDCQEVTAGHMSFLYIDICSVENNLQYDVSTDHLRGLKGLSGYRVSPKYLLCIFYNAIVCYLTGMHTSL